jgi:hypothetical protein
MAVATAVEIELSKRENGTTLQENPYDLAKEIEVSRSCAKI